MSKNPKGSQIVLSPLKMCFKKSENNLHSAQKPSKHSSSTENTQSLNKNTKRSTIAKVFVLFGTQGAIRKQNCRNFLNKVAWSNSCVVSSSVTTRVYQNDQFMFCPVIICWHLVGFLRHLFHKTSSLSQKSLLESWFLSH